MKKLIKFILIFVLVIVLIAVGIVAGVYISLSNNTDDTPYTLYSADANKSNIISSTLSSGFDLKDKNYIDITLNENELNLLVFCIIREKINDKYLPIDKNEADYTNPANYVWNFTLPSDVFLVGGKGVVVKSLYAKIEGDNLKLFAPAIVGNKQSCVELYLSFEETADSFLIKIDTLKVGKVNYAGNGAKRILKIASKFGLTDESIEAKLSTDELKVNVDLQNLKIGVTKDSLGSFLDKMITDNISSDEVTASTLSSLAQMITSKENDMLDLGVFNDRFGIRCDMSKADVDDNQLLLNEKYQNFDEELYITTTTQSFAISNISSSEPKITISEEDFNAMIFAKSNGYQDFKVEFNIPSTDATIKLQVYGIEVNLDENTILINIMINLNGLKTVIEVSGSVSGNNTNRVLISINKEIKIGKGESDSTKSYIKAKSDFIKVLLAEKISEIEMMDYDEEANALVLSANNFNEMLSVSGGSALPVSAKKLALTDKGLDVYVEINNPLVQASLDIVTNAISDFLENTTLASSSFDTTDPAQEQAVNELLSIISTSSDAISAGDISEEDTNNLIEAIQMLSSDNKEVLYSSIEDSMLTSDLTSLYDQLFGK